jgi:hypothetical protein
MLEDQSLFTRSDKKLYCCIFPTALLAALSPAQWVPAGKMHLL